jgi:hypothetical protein
MRLLLPAALAVSALGSCAAQAPSPRPELRVLFIGNSLTYVNDLPAIAVELARADGAVSLETATVAYPNFSLEDHLVRGEAASRIAAGGWDFVVLQQGPSALPTSRTELIDAARQFAALCARAGARMALYSVWPAADRLSAFDSVTASYAAAADSVGALLLPAGRAWQFAWQRDPSLPLYGTDGFHPGPSGSYLTALVIYRGLTGRSPVGLPETVTIGGVRMSIPPGQASIMQEAAAVAVP